MLDGRPVTDFKSNKVRALLSFLAVEANRQHRRETLAGMLWPDRTDRDALSNLRYSLASLRKTLDDRSAAVPFLLISHDTIQFNLASGAWLDVDQIEQKLARARRHYAAAAQQAANRLPDAVMEDLQSAVALYRGSFLQGFSVGGAAPFEEWALLRGEQILQQVITGLGSLVAEMEARGNYAAAQTYARQQTTLEPWNEAAHRALMRALALDDQRNAALHQFQTCRRILWDELGVEPAEETLALEEAIRGGLETMRQREREKQGATGRQSQSKSFSPEIWATCQPVSPAPPVVARDPQLTHLDALLGQALAGAGRVVFVTGEAGSGKTALLDEFARRAMQTQANLLVARGMCDALTGIGDPYLPFREVLQLLTGDIEPKRAGATLAPDHARRLWSAMPDALRAMAEHGPHLIDAFVPRTSLILRAEAFTQQSSSSKRQAWWPQLLQPAAAIGEAPPGLPTLDAHLPLQKTDLFEQFTHVLQALAQQHPLLLVLDDFQWADAGSINLLFHLGRRITASPILIAVAYRPDAITSQPGAGRHPLEVVAFELRRISGEPAIDLDQCAGRPFIEALLDVEPNRLDGVFRQQLLQHTEGHPLFTVEVLRSLQERGELARDGQGRWIRKTTLHWDKLPARVEAAIGERIGRLSDCAQALLAAGSVEGEEFTAEVIADALNIDAAAALHCLSSDLLGRHQLVTAVSLHRLGARKLSRFRFRHHLFQQYMYNRLDIVRRTHLHEAIGRALELLHQDAPDEMEALAPRLAWHFEAAGLAEQAASYHLRAGKRATKLAAHEEAIDHLTRGLALVETMPDSPQRARLSLDLHLASVSPLSYVRGFWSAERIAALERAYAISKHPLFNGGDVRFTTAAAVAYFALWSADPRRSVRISEELLHNAQQTQNGAMLRWAHMLLGMALSTQGQLPAAQEHLALGLDSQDDHDDGRNDLAVGVDVRILSLAWRAFTWWQLGYAERGAAALQAALTTAQARGEMNTYILTQGMACMIHFVCARDSTAAWQQVQALRRQPEVGAVFGVWADSLTGAETPDAALQAESVSAMQQGMLLFEKTGSGLGRAAQRLMLAQAQGRAGQAQAGIATLDAAQAWMASTGVLALAGEAQRLRGDLLLLTQPHHPKARQLAEAEYRGAIARARQQQARWWELRATVSLCRLLAQQDTSHRSAARRMLAEIYDWFSEGFDSKDLCEARELLAHLAQD